MHIPVFVSTPTELSADQAVSRKIVERLLRDDGLVAMITDVEYDKADPYVIQLTEVDPLPGQRVLVASLAPLRRQWFTDAPVGMLTGASLTGIEAAVRDLFDL